VFAGEVGDESLVGGESGGIFRVDGEIDQGGAGFGVRIVFPEATQGALDLADFDWETGGGKEGGVH
jgi:hypothetical protein